MRGRVFRFLPCFAVAVGAIGPAAGQDARTQVLTWDRCMQTALERNPDIQAANEALARARAEKQAAHGATMPQVSLDASYTRYEDDSAATAPPEVSPSGSTNQQNNAIQLFPITLEDYSISLQARQDLYTGGRLSAQIDKKEAYVRLTTARAAAVRNNVLCDLKRAFTRFLFAQRLIALSKDIAARRKSNLELVRLRFEGGLEHKGSFLLSQALHNEATIDVGQAARARAVAQRELVKVLGWGEDADLTVSGNLVFSQKVWPTNLEQVVASHPAYLEKEAGCDAAGEDLTIARSQFKPAVSLSGTLAQHSEDTTLDQNRWSLVLAASLPVFKGWQNVHGLESARAFRRQAAEELRSKREELRFELARTQAALDDARERVLSQQQLLEAAKTRAEIAKEQYNSGLLKFENWDLIENDLIAKQKRMLEALRDAIIAEADLQQALGTGAMP